MRELDEGSSKRTACPHPVHDGVGQNTEVGHHRVGGGDYQGHLEHAVAEHFWMLGGQSTRSERELQRKDQFARLSS